MPGFSSFRKAALLPIGGDERCGFGEVHRGFNESEIAADVAWKLPNLGRPCSTFFDIGCGCSSLTHELLSFHLSRGGGSAILQDSEEMLDALELMGRGIETLAGRFPDVRPESSFDSVLVYSVLHCLDDEQDPLDFVIRAAEHLNESGRLLIGDIPNADKRKRFLASDFGRAFDKRWRTNSAKGVSWDGDGGAGFFSEDFIFGAVEQLRRLGFEVYLLPQRPELPFSYTRDDILVIRI